MDLDRLDLDDLIPDLSSPIEFGKALPEDDTTSVQRRPVTSNSSPLKGATTIGQQVTQARDGQKDAITSTTAVSTSVVTTKSSSQSSIQSNVQSSVTSATATTSSTGSSSARTTKASSSSNVISQQLSSTSIRASSTSSVSFSTSSTTSSQRTSSSTPVTSKTSAAGARISQSTTIYPNVFATNLIPSTTPGPTATSNKSNDFTIAGLTRNQTTGIVIGAVFGSFTFLFLVLWIYSKIAKRRKGKPTTTATA